VKASGRVCVRVLIACVVALTMARHAHAQDQTDTSSDAQAAAAPAATPQATDQPASPPRLVCGSEAGTRTQCGADTSAGVVLVRSTGAAACLLGKTWGYDDTGVWVSDGCTGEFITGQATSEPADKKSFEHIPNVGFRLYEGEKGQVYFRLFSYARYLNQRDLDSSYVDAFGNTHSVNLRQDVQLQKFFAPFTGWFLTPKFRYYL